MKWAQEHSSTHFELPNMPHLDEEQKVLFKQQVREREEDLELKRKEDSRAMAAEERAQKEMKRKKKNEFKRKSAAEELTLLDEGMEKAFNSVGNSELTSDVTIKLEQTNSINEIKESSIVDSKEKGSQDEEEKGEDRGESKEEQKADLQSESTSHTEL